MKYFVYWCFADGSGEGERAELFEFTSYDEASSHYSRCVADNDTTRVILIKGESLLEY